MAKYFYTYKQYQKITTMTIDLPPKCLMDNMDIFLHKLKDRPEYFIDGMEAHEVKEW